MGFNYLYMKHQSETLLTGSTVLLTAVLVQLLYFYVRNQKSQRSQGICPKIKIITRIYVRGYIPTVATFLRAKSDISNDVLVSQFSWRNTRKTHTCGDYQFMADFTPLLQDHRLLS